MSSILPLLLLVVFFASVAMMASEGLWSSAIMLVNVMTAALLATNYFEPLANWIELKDQSWKYVLDFLSIWLIFCGTLVVLRLATDKVSRVKVKFKLPVEWAGGVFFSAWVGWIMVCFTLFSLHTAPLARNFLFGAFQEDPKSDMFFGLAPDKVWLAYVHTTSIDGGLAKGREENQSADTNVFDPRAEFILKYGTRRQAFEKVEDIRVRPDQ